MIKISGRYVRIATKFWTDEKIIELDSDTKLLYLYMLSCPHSNMAGYYRLPMQYIQADLEGLGKGLPKGLAKGFAKLLEEGLIKYCEKSSVVLVVNYFKYNPIQNINQAKGAVKKTSELPTNSLVEDYKQAISMYAKDYTEGLSKGLPKGLPKGLGKGLPNTVTVTVTEAVTETEAYIGVEEKKETKTYAPIIEYLNNKCGTNYKPTTKKTKEFINARIKEGFKVEDFETVIDKKTNEWINSDMEKFLRPQTLFGTNFEGYLNQKINNKDKNSNTFLDMIEEEPEDE